MAHPTRETLFGTEGVPGEPPRDAPPEAAVRRLLALGFDQKTARGFTRRQAFVVIKRAEVRARNRGGPLPLAPEAIGDLGPAGEADPGLPVGLMEEHAAWAWALVDSPPESVQELREAAKELIDDLPYWAVWRVIQAGESHVRDRMAATHARIREAWAARKGGEPWRG